MTTPPQPHRLHYRRSAPVAPNRFRPWQIADRVARVLMILMFVAVLFGCLFWVMPCRPMSGF